MKYFFVSLLSVFIFFSAGTASAEKFYVLRQDGTVVLENHELVAPPKLNPTVNNDVCDTSVEATQVWWEFLQVWGVSNCGDWSSKWKMGEGAVIWVVAKGEKPEPVAVPAGYYPMACYSAEAYWLVWNGTPEPAVAPSSIIRSLRCQYLEQGAKG